LGKSVLANSEKMAPLKIKSGGVYMTVLRQRDLLLLMKGGAKVEEMVLKPIKLTIKDKTYFEVFLTLTTMDGVEEYIMINSKNESQKWASINKAIDTFSTLIPHLKKVIVEIEE